MPAATRSGWYTLSRSLSHRSGPPRPRSIYAPAVPVLLAALAIGQMGVHLSFFLHLSSAPDQANNMLALVFGVFVSGLIIFGSIMIMAHLNQHVDAHG